MTSREGTLTTIVSAEGVTLQPDDQFRWTAQKRLWAFYRPVLEVLGLAVPGERRLKKKDLERNSEHLAEQRAKMITELQRRGMPRYAARSLLLELGGGFLMRELTMEDIRRKIEERVACHRQDRDGER